MNRNILSLLLVVCLFALTSCGGGGGGGGNNVGEFDENFGDNGVTVFDSNAKRLLELSTIHHATEEKKISNREKNFLKIREREFRFRMSPKTSRILHRQQLKLRAEGDDVVFAVAVDSLDRLILVGSTQDADSIDILIIRLDDAGDFDTTFDTDGVLIINVSEDAGIKSDDVARSVVIDADDNIIIAGRTEDLENNDNDVLLIRVLEDGTLDTTFGGGDGIVVEDTDVDNADEAVAVALDGNDNIVVTIQNEQDDATVARFDNVGDLDTTFSDDGIATLGQTGSLAIDLLIDVNDILVVGLINNNGLLFKLDENGDVDVTFGDNGFVENVQGDSNVFQAIQFDNDGKILVAGFLEENGETEVLVARFLDTGDIDNTFDNNGTRNFEAIAGGNEDFATAIFPFGDDILVIGQADNVNNQTQGFVASLQRDGDDNLNFGANGTFKSDGLQGIDNIQEAFGDGALDSQDRVLVGGVAINADGNDDAVGARILAGNAARKKNKKSKKSKSNINQSK